MSQQQQHSQIVSGHYQDQKEQYHPHQPTNTENEAFLKAKTEVFIWGNAVPRNMFCRPNTYIQDWLTPYKVDNFASKQIYNISAAREGSHCFGMGKNNWLFVWGETKQIGALGLGTDSCSTAPFPIRALRKHRVILTCCSAVHSLCVTDKGVVYGWGSKSLTLLSDNNTAPEPLPFLNGKGITKLCASNTHSLAYNTHSLDVYSFGIRGEWLGLNDNNAQSFGKIQIEKANVQLCVRDCDCSSQYTVIVLNNGMAGVCGINEHGRMGLGKNIYKTAKVIWSPYLRGIISCSAAVFHSGFVDVYGNVFTVGLGNDFRHGQSHTQTLFIPQRIQSLNAYKIYSIECVNERMYVITQSGHLFMFGKEPITGRVHQNAFVFRYFDAYKVYKVCGAKDFCVALAVPRGNEQKMASFMLPSNDSVDAMKPNKVMDDTNYEIAKALSNHPKFGNGSAHVKTVIPDGSLVRSEQVQYGAPQFGNSYGAPQFRNNNVNGVDEVFGNVIGFKRVVFGGSNIPPPPPLHHL